MIEGMIEGPHLRSRNGGAETMAMPRPAPVQTPRTVALPVARMSVV